MSKSQFPCNPRVYISPNNINLFNLRDLKELTSKQIYDNAKTIAMYTLTTVVEEWDEVDLLLYEL
jgi:hypothetical protein